MIKATFEGRTGHTLLIGLTRENVNRLFDNQPIRILPDAALDLPITIAIMAGESEEDITEALAPFFGPSTVFHGVPESHTHVSRETEN